MKKLLVLLFIPIVCLGQISSEWTKEELSYADVARDVVFITDVEKDIILYHNLVRLYPKKYLELEILKWRKDIYPKDTIKFNFVWESLDLSSNYYKSLVKTLKKQKPLPKFMERGFNYNLSRRLNAIRFFTFLLTGLFLIQNKTFPLYQLKLFYLKNRP